MTRARARRSPGAARGAGDPGQGAESASRVAARRPGEALHPPGPRLGPRRRCARRRAIEGRQAGVGYEGTDRVRDDRAPGRRRPGGRPGARRAGLPPQGRHLPEVPRDRRRRRPGRTGPGEHRRQRPARLPGRLDPPAQQAGQGELPRHRRGHRRRPDLHRDQAPPDRHRAGVARRRGPRGLDPRLLHRRSEDGRLDHAGRTGRRV